MTHGLAALPTPLVQATGTRVLLVAAVVRLRGFQGLLFVVKLLALLGSPWPL
jgi:hypothetical protein